jgi:hypothetical protein
MNAAGQKTNNEYSDVTSYPEELALQLRPPPSVGERNQANVMEQYELDRGGLDRSSSRDVGRWP